MSNPSGTEVVAAGGRAQLGRRSPGHGLLITVLVTGALMDLLDVTVVNVALPTLRRALGATPTQLEWMIAGYLLAFGSTLIVWGRVGDRFGRRRVFLVGVAGFGLASLTAGTAPSAGLLVAARLAQGCAAGALIPQVLGTFRAALPERPRTVAFGIYGAVAGLAAALGVVLGGLLTQYSLLGLGWRAVFLINLPISVLAFLGGLLVVPETTAVRTGRLDLAGGLLLIGSLTAIVWPLLEGRALGWPWWTGGLLTAGVIGLLALAGREHRSADQVAGLLDLAQFGAPAFAAGIAVQALFGAALQGFSLSFVVWLQVGHAVAPLDAGLVLVAMSAGTMLTAPLAGRLAASHGNRVLIVGAALLALGVLVVGLPARSASLPMTATLLTGLAVAGAGLGLLVVPLVDVVLAAVPAASAAGAAGVFSTSQQVGGALGIAAIGSVFFAHAGLGPALGPSATAALDHAFGIAVPIAAAGFALAGALCTLLPARTADHPAVTG